MALECAEAVSSAHFYVNGKSFTDSINPKLTLLQYLRNMGLTGTKLGCGEGGCGACFNDYMLGSTVMVSHFDFESQKVVNRSVNACLFPAAAIDGCHVITVEGIGSTKTVLHPVQSRIAEFFGSQCGFCTPGFVMALYSCLRNNPKPTMHELEEIFDGNLCRCTGYRPILDAAKSFAVDRPTVSCGVENCCQNEFKANEVDEISFDKLVVSDSTGHEQSIFPRTGENDYTYRKNICSDSVSKMNSYDSYATVGGNELIFPPALSLYKPKLLRLCHDHTTWFRPISLRQLFAIKTDYPNSKFIFGNTEVGIDVKFRRLDVPVYISLSHVSELQKVYFNSKTNCVHFGAASTLTFISEFISQTVLEKGESLCQNLSAIQFQLRRFASHQIRNVACMGGNIVNASPISDLNPVLQASNAIFVLQCNHSERHVLAKDFFLSYRKVDLHHSEVLKEIIVPLNVANEFAFAYKQARRRDDDISIVTSGFRVLLKPENNSFIVDTISLCYGGMAPITKSAHLTESFMAGKLWSAETLDKALLLLVKDFPMDAKTPGGQHEYRLTLCASFLFKFFMHVCNRLPGNNLSVKELDAAIPFHRDISQGAQIYQETSNMSKLVGQNRIHASAYLQCTGEALYCDDIPIHNVLHAAAVTSAHPHAKIISVDASAALSIPGVVDYISAKDIPASGHNTIGDYFLDEEVFPTTTVLVQGMCIGLIVAENEHIASMAAKLVKVHYEDLPVIMSIEDAIAHSSFFPTVHRVEKGGDVTEMLNKAKNRISGEVRIGGQEHFYLETNSCIIVPTGENDELTVYSSTQNPTKMQEMLAHVLGLQQNRVVVKVKRIGGGFGGKETRSFHYASTVAVAARKLNRPVKLNIERDLDMSTSGHRHPFLIKYDIGFEDDGKILASDVVLYSNGGFSHDLSIPVMNRALLSLDNCTEIPVMRSAGIICKTNTASNTAFRGFGSPQGCLYNIVMLHHVAHKLGVSFEKVMLRNLLHPTNAVTPYGQPVLNFPILKMWNELKVSCDYDVRFKEIALFNSLHKYKKRGFSLLPNKFPIAFEPKFMNQGAALVHIYSDGSVLLSHGGVEMGQGLHTKMMQIAATALQIAMEYVHVIETATDKVANTFPSAASFSSDLNGGAILNACYQLNERLKPYRESYPNLTWSEITHKAHFERVNLSAQGFFSHPLTQNLNWDPITGLAPEKSHPYAYFAYGVAATEVEVDCLTGDWNCLRTDLLVDVGASLNPGLDIGQIEGAFIQGMGWCTMEELIWGDSAHSWVRPGHLFTKGPGTYKIPSANDVPIDFRIKLLGDSRNPRAVHSSKAVGEPPLFLGCSVMFAIKDAITHYRLDAGLNEWFDLHSPATTERIRMACLDKFSSPFADANFQARTSV